MPGFEVFGDKEKQEIMDVLETGVLFVMSSANSARGYTRSVHLRRILPGIPELDMPRGLPREPWP